jgi:transposase
VRAQRTSVGLDMHALSAVACGIDEDTGGSVQKAAESRLQRGPCLATNAPESVKVVYEAGPTGFGLCRGTDRGR